MEGRRLLKNTAQREIENFADIAIKTTNVAGVSYIQRSQNVGIFVTSSMATIPARKYNDLMVKIVQGGV